MDINRENWNSTGYLLSFFMGVQELLSRLASFLDKLPWSGIVENLLKNWKRYIGVKTSEGMYEVLEYESVLELKDERGEKATVKKREKVRYLQDNIIAYQDQAWGDGKILVNYCCSPGIPVDRYRSGYKTHILLSLRDVKHRGDVDEFHIQWGIERGFLLKTGFWGTEVSHPTREMTVKIIFPKNRPPVRVMMVERNQKRTKKVDEDARVQLPDGRWMIEWEKHQPPLYEQYILKWEW